jgi:hypothetical protein
MAMCGLQDRSRFSPFLLFVLLFSLDGLMVDSRPVAYLNSTVAEVTMVSSTKNCCFFLTSIAKDAIEAGIKKKRWTGLEFTCAAYQFSFL